MNPKTKIVESDDPWEDRRIGAEEEFVEVAPDISEELNEALDLHPISIRLQKNLIDNLKALAQLNGLGYQPLIRQVLTRWVDCELKQMLIQRAHEKRAQEVASTVQAPSPKQRDPVPRHKKAA